MVSLEGFGLLLLFFRVILLVKFLFPVSQNFDDPDVNEVTDFGEVLRAFKVFIFLCEDHFKFFFSESLVISEFGFDHFLSEIIVVVTCTWNPGIKSTRFP